MDLDPLVNKPEHGVLPALKKRLPLRFLRIEEVFDFRLFEFKRSENELTGRNFVAEAFADIADAERKLDPGGIQDIGEVGENPLRRFAAQVNRKLLSLDDADRRLEHDIKRFRRENVVPVGRLNPVPFDKRADLV